MRLASLYVWRAGLAVFALYALVAYAEAQEYCVACTGPSAVYRCIIDGAKPGGKQPLQTLCVTAMTKEGQHTQCNVKGGTVFDCNGPVKRVPWANYNAPGKSATPESPRPQTATAPPPSDPNQPPKTVEEMAKRANQQTADQIRHTNENLKDNVESFGDKVGATTKKTWRCIASLFTQCNE